MGINPLILQPCAACKMRILCKTAWEKRSLTRFLGTQPSRLVKVEHTCSVFTDLFEPRQKIRAAASLAGRGGVQASQQRLREFHKRSFTLYMPNAGQSPRQTSHPAYPTQLWIAVSSACTARLQLCCALLGCFLMPCLAVPCHSRKAL